MDNYTYPLRRIAFNQCPKCLGMLKLIEQDVTRSTINKYGLITDSEDEYIITLECTVCHEKYNGTKKGNHYLVGNTLPVIRKPKKVEEVGYNPFQI